MRFTIPWLFCVILLFCVSLLLWLASCNSWKGDRIAQTPRAVCVPRRFWPGCKSAPEMDMVFQELRPGQALTLKLIFADRRNRLVTPEVIAIKSGSVFFYSEAGYFRFDSEGKVYSCPDGEEEVALDSFTQQIQIHYDVIWETKSTNDMKFKKQPIKSETVRGRHIGYIVVRLSPDFEGEMTGWRSCRGK
jgi:hypothetical protein